MAIKQIKLRGISRVPSDRMNEDGGLAESVNMMIDHEEQAPMPAPVDVTDVIGLPDIPASYDEGKYFFVHRTSAYTNYFVRLEGGDDFNNSAICVCVKKNGVYQYATASFSIDATEKITSTVAIGNTVIVLTDKNSYYLYYKDNDYKLIGNGIPELDVRFSVGKKGTVPEKTTSSRLYMAYEKGTKEFLRLYNNYLSGSTEYNATTERVGQSIRNLETTIWDSFNSYQAGIKENEKNFTAPVFVRYAIRMYDGSYIHQSVPVLLGAGVVSGLNIRLGMEYNENTSDTDEKTLCTIKYSPSDSYKVTAKLITDIEFAQWKDIIKGVDFFVTSDIMVPEMSSKIKRFTDIYVSDPTFTPNRCTCNLEFDYNEKTAEDILTDHAEFYKIASYNTEDFSKLYSGVQLKPMTQDMLSVQTTLKDDENSHYKYTASSSAMEYAERLVLVGITSHIPDGYPHFQAQRESSTVSAGGNTTHSYKVVWYTKEEGGFKCARVNTMNNDEALDTFAYLSYPGTGCYRVEVIDTNTGFMYRYDMKEHPLLNTSYFFGGLDKKLKDCYTAREHLSSVNEYIEFVTDTYADKFSDNTRILMSESSNPFLFPSDGNMRFAGDVLDVASTTVSLEHMQRYDFYVFTILGIYLVVTNGVGLPERFYLVSRDVIMRGSHVTTTLKSVVYFTERGVSMISGTSVTDISDAMVGKKDSIPSYVSTKIIDSVCHGVAEKAGTESIQFLDWIKDASCTYDYAGHRLLFSANEKESLLVYDLMSGTWHTMIPGVMTVGKVDSFPDALINVYDHNNKCRLYSFSTPVVGSRTTMPQIIYTRAFDLGERDVRKTIKHLRIRGNHEKAHVQYLILGSMDGHTWGILPSLRGSSCKLYRLAVMGQLTENERLSWIDVDYDTRFTNRLR